MLFLGLLFHANPTLSENESHLRLASVTLGPTREVPGSSNNAPYLVRLSGISCREVIEGGGKIDFFYILYN